jgi:hypothetical protein
MIELQAFFVIERSIMKCTSIVGMALKAGKYNVDKMWL